jgi:type II secretion system protein C
MVGFEIVLGLGVAVLGGFVVGSGTRAWLDDAEPIATQPIAPRPTTAVTSAPDVDTILAGFGTTRGAGHAAARPRLRVWGVATHGEDRLAVIEDADGLQGLHREGDTVGEATIVEIAWDGVTIEANGHRVHLPLEAPASAAPAPPAAAPPPLEPVPVREIRQINRDSYIVDRAHLMGQLANMSGLLAQLRAVPEVAAGEPIGFRVFSIAEDSILRRLGLRNGDVVRRVNGTELRDPTALLSFLQGMGDQTRIALDVVRGGEPETLVYDLR